VLVQPNISDDIIVLITTKINA